MPHSPSSISLPSQHVDFLRKLHSGVTLKKPCSEYFRRYIYLWLPLVAKSYDSERIVRTQLAPLKLPLPHKLKR